MAQSVEAISARAVNLALAGRPDAAREAADEAERLADRLRYPVGKAASLEARGAVAADPDESSAALAEAREAWQALGRPLDAARCEYLRGRLLRDSAPEEAREALQRPPPRPSATASTTSRSSPAGMPASPSPRLGRGG